jgi:hypothetical protein
MKADLLSDLQETDKCAGVRAISHTARASRAPLAGRSGCFGKTRKTGRGCEAVNVQILKKLDDVGLRLREMDQGWARPLGHSCNGNLGRYANMSGGLKSAISLVLDFSFKVDRVPMSNKSITLKTVCNELAGKLLAEKDPTKSHQLSEMLRSKMKELDAVIRGGLPPSRAARSYLRQRSAS